MTVPLLYDRYDDNEEQEGAEKRNLRAGVRVNSRVKVSGGAEGRGASGASGRAHDGYKRARVFGGGAGTV